MRTYKKKWPRMHLGELVAFLEEQHPEGINVEAVSKKLGMTKQFFSSTFSKDDMKLSRAESIARVYGYELKLFFPLKQWKYGFTPITKYKKKDYPNAGNLKGLYEFLYDSNKTINSFSQEMGMSNCVLTQAFKTGDIFISTLFLIIEALEIEVIWKFEKTENL